MLVSCLVDFHQTTRRYIPEDRTLHNHRCENLKPCIVYNKVQLIWVLGCGDIREQTCQFISRTGVWNLIRRAKPAYGIPDGLKGVGEKKTSKLMAVWAGGRNVKILIAWSSLNKTGGEFGSWSPMESDRDRTPLQQQGRFLPEHVT
jgi:hypothetical protein